MIPSTPASTPPRRRVILRLLAFAFGGYVLCVGMFALLQRSLMYPALRSGPLPASNFPLAGVVMNDVTVTTADGLTLHGWHAWPADSPEVDIPQNDSNRPVILFLHGNGGNRFHRLDEIDLLTGLGAEVVLFDYRGYGENPGSPSEAGLTTDARAFWNFTTKQRGVAPERIIVLGESLGGGVAVRLAAEQADAGASPGGLILRSAFSSMTEAAEYHYPWLPIRLALLDRYEAAGRIGRVTCPILAIHGDADDIIPLELGRRLFDAAPERSASGIEKRFVVLRGAGHNDILFAARDAYRAALATFLRDVTSDDSDRSRADHDAPFEHPNS